MILKEKEILGFFSACKEPSDTYDKIITLGQEARKKEFKHPGEENLVPGCQSILYLSHQVKDGLLFFEAFSEALISMGLAQLLVWYYSGESAETILKEPPTFLEKLNIPASLTPSRVNGLYNIHLKMKQKALESLVSSKSS